jgi:threonine 3-dehydrogenase
MSVMLENGVNIAPIITHRFHCTDFEQGFAAMESGNCGKVVLDWTS